MRVTMRSPLLSENPADIEQMAYDYVEARWGLRFDSETSDVVRWIGEAYTLYSDGSIEAQLPQGTLRFGSISELRLHLEQSASYLAAERRSGSSSK